MRNILLSVLLLISYCATAITPNQPLPATQAFNLSAQVTTPNQVLLHWQIAPGYHLYRDRIAIALAPHATAVLMPLKLPAGLVKTDSTLGSYQIFEGQLDLPITVQHAANSKIILSVQYQGCADSGFCYPPTTQTITLLMATNRHSDLNISTIPSTDHNDTAIQLTMPQHSNGLFTLLSFFGFGLLLAFTPCVFPMLPILSGIIVGQGTVTNPRKAFYLSSTYVLGMASAYTLAGLLAGLVGNYLQASLQNPWILGLFSLVFVGLALSLFGAYELRLPTIWQQRLHLLHHRQQGGTYLGVMLMGALSMLIVSPCVSAPLIAALSYLSRTGNIGLSGAALFIMALGMGTPLILIGTLGGRLLPQAGTWMHSIKVFFGVLLLAIAIQLIGRILPGPFNLVLWASLSMLSSLFLGIFNKAHNNWQKFGKRLGLLLFGYGIVLLIGACQGNSDPLRPLTKISTTAETLHFQTVTTTDDLQRVLTLAQRNHKPTLIDFYADWCINCQVLDRKVFTDPAVTAALQNYVLIRADVTANNIASRAMQQHYSVIAPPTLIFIDQNGHEIKRAVGELKARQFLMLMKHS